MVLLERNLADFAHYYFFSDLMSEGVDAYSLSADELVQLKSESELPVYIAGRADYAPFFYIFFPLSLLPFWSALTMWMCVTWRCPACVRQPVGRVHPPFRCYRDRLVCTCLGDLPGFPAAIRVSWLGQINIFLLLFLILVQSLADRKTNDLIPAVFLALVLLTKPQFGTLFILYLLWGRFRLCGYTLLLYTILHTIPVGLYGWGPELSYWHNLLHHLSSSDINVHNLSLKALFSRTLEGGPLEFMSSPAYMITSLAIAIASYIVGSSLKDAVKWNRRRLPEGRSGSPGFDAAVWVDRFPELVDDLGDFWCHGHSSPVL